MKKLVLSALLATIGTLGVFASTLPADTLNWYSVDGKRVDNFDGSILVGKTIGEYKIIEFYLDSLQNNVVKLHVICSKEFVRKPPKPLYVVDGEVYKGKPSAIKPENIKSMTMLKKGSEAAKKYGEQGAVEGVILITTKKGAED